MSRARVLPIRPPLPRVPVPVPRWFPEYLQLSQHLRHINWFPGHMASGMQRIRERARSVNAVLEVRDARVPLSCANVQLRRTLADDGRERTHIIMLSKTDLVPEVSWRRHADALAPSCNLLVVGAKESLKAAQQIVQHLEAVAISRPASAATTMLVCGLPNVGKSTVINLLRRSVGLTNAAPKGMLPGVTRSLSHRVGLTHGGGARLYVLDSPGIIDPSLRAPEQSLNLALASLLPDSVADIEGVAQFLFVQCRRAYYLGHTPTNLVAATPQCPSDVAALLAEDPVLGACGKIGSQADEPSLPREQREGGRVAKAAGRGKAESAWLRPRGAQDPTTANYTSPQEQNGGGDLAPESALIFQYFVEQLGRAIGSPSMNIGGGVDRTRVCRYFVENFRRGVLGRLSLDDISYETPAESIGSAGCTKKKMR